MAKTMERLGRSDQTTRQAPTPVTKPVLAASLTAEIAPVSDRNEGDITASSTAAEQDPYDRLKFDYDWKKHDTYAQRMARYDLALLDVAKQYVTWVLTLASGALGLTLTFIKNIAPVVRPDSKLYLILSFIGLGLSIACTLSSLLFSQHTIEREIEVYQQSERCDDPNDRLKVDSRNSAATITRWLNGLSLFAFIVGVAMLCVFTIMNI